MKKSLNSNLDKMILYNISQSSSQSTGFPNKYSNTPNKCSNTSSVNVLACHAEKNTSLDLVSMIIKCGISLRFYELEKAPSYFSLLKDKCLMYFDKCFLFIYGNDLFFCLLYSVTVVIVIDF